MAAERLAVEVVIAFDGWAQAVTLEVPAGTTLRGAVERSRIDLAECARRAGLPAGGWTFGIFGELLPPDTLLEAGDRVEIYRGLRDDPKAIRRRRAAARAMRR